MQYSRGRPEGSPPPRRSSRRPACRRTGQLFTQGLVSSRQLQQSQSAEQEFDTGYALDRERLQMAADNVEAQLAVEQAEVDRLRTLYELRQHQMAIVINGSPVTIVGVAPAELTSALVVRHVSTLGLSGS